MNAISKLWKVLIGDAEPVPNPALKVIINEEMAERPAQIPRTVNGNHIATMEIVRTEPEPSKSSLGVAWLQDGEPKLDNKVYWVAPEDMLV